MAKSMKTAFIRVSSENNTQNGLVTYSKNDIDTILRDWSASANFIYWFIEHTADEDISMTHWHIVIKFKTPMPFDNIKSHIPYGDIENAKSIKSCVQYLVHLNDMTKTQYDWSDIVTNCDDMTPYKVQSISQGEIVIQRIMEQIENGEIREYNQFEKIPIDVWSKYKTRIENGLTYYRERVYMDKDRQINVVFMSGDTGVGKTSFAKHYCIQAKKSFCVSSSSNDPMQDYKGEDVLILDDLRDSDFKFTDLLKILDNHTKTTMKARYHNKAFIGELIIITSYKPLCDWYSGSDIPDESLQQLYRRIQEQYIFYEDYIECYQYNDDLRRYERVGKVPNIITMKAKEKAKRVFNMVKTLGLELEPTIEQKIVNAIDDISEEQFEIEFTKAKDDSELPFC